MVWPVQVTTVSSDGVFLCAVEQTEDVTCLKPASLLKCLGGCEYLCVFTEGFHILWLDVLQLHMSFKVHCSGDTWINFHYSGFFNVFKLYSASVWYGT